MRTPLATSENRDLTSAVLHRALEQIYVPYRASVAVSQKEKLYDMARERIGPGPLTYLEFGVWQGWSMRCITDRFTNADARFFGFDSFEGLPERWGGVPAGEFSTGGAAPAIADPRVQFIHGWFQNTVPSFLAEHSFDNPVLVNFDADLYSSTLFLLTTLWHHVVEYDFVFDEFCGDEVVAMRDFACAYPVEFEFHGALLQGDAPMQVYGSMKRANF